jgi:PAS domain S-box-containing protein
MQSLSTTSLDLGAGAPWLPRPETRFDRDPVFREVFFDSPQAMWLVDARTLKFVEANAAAIRLYGYSRREFLEMSLCDLAGAGRETRAQAERAQRRSAALFHPDQRHRVKSGAEISVDLHSWLLHRSGSVRLVMVKEVTDLQHAVSLLCRHWHHLADLVGEASPS